MAGQKIQVGTGLAAYYAFVPAPLPPTLSFDSNLILKLSEADRALGELAGLGNALPNPRLLIRPFIRKEAVLSSRIEGTESDLEDLYVFEAEQLALRGLSEGESRSDVQEVANYVRALEFGLEQLADPHGLPMSLRLIRELHARLMSDVRGQEKTPGEFRRSQNWIGFAGCSLNEATYVPPPVEEMVLAMQALESYLHAPHDYPPLVRLALTHYQFEAIHPFLDGNGRIGRLLITLLMASWNLLPTPLLYLSAFFEKHRALYNDLLLAVSEQDRWEEWISFFLQGIKEQSQDAILRAKQLQMLRADWKDRLTQVKASVRTISLANSLFEHPIITIPLVHNRFGVSFPSAKQLVEKLVLVGILTLKGENGYRKRYQAQEIMLILGENNAH